MKKQSLQHYQLPNKMQVSARDQYIYLLLKSHVNGITKLCFPSLKTLASESGLSIPTVRKCIDNLKNFRYIGIVNHKRKNYYLFSKYKKFEPFSPDFLKQTKISPTTKAYLIAIQQYMYKEIENIGKISYTNMDLSRLTGIPESTIRKCNNELASLNILEILKNKNRTETKVFKMNELHQEIIWLLKEHEEQLSEHDADIKNIKKDVDELKEYKLLVSKLMKQLKEEKQKNQKIEKVVIV